MAEDLSRHGEVLAEAVQLLLRMDGNTKGYEDVRKAIENGTFSIPEKYVARIGEYLGLASDPRPGLRKGSGTPVGPTREEEV